jgi:hypothetical protein
VEVQYEEVVYVEVLLRGGTLRVTAPWRDELGCG